MYTSELQYINVLRRYDMNERSQMQGEKLDIVEKDKCKPVYLRLSLAGNLEKQLMSLYGTEWRERGYGLSICICVGKLVEAHYCCSARDWE